MAEASDSDQTALTASPPPSPLSPCVWTPAEHEPAPITAAPRVGWVSRDPLSSVAATSASAPTSSSISVAAAAPLPTAPPPRQRELMLSPASQLDVLSQISELADAQRRQAVVLPALPSATERSHAWAPAMRGGARQKKGASGDTTTSSSNDDGAVNSSRSPPKAKAKERKRPSLSQAKKLAADMLDWETCSEDLFAGDTEDEWVYDDISDSDFD